MRLFIALELPKDIIDYIETVQNKFKNRGLFTGTYPTKNNIHMTLIFLGDQPESAIPSIIKTMHTITTPIELLLDGVNLDNPHHPHVVWIDVISDQLTAVAQQLARDLRSKEERPFKGHITVARIKYCPSIDALKKAVDSCAKNPHTFFGTQLTLYASTLTTEGPVYESKYVQRFTAF